MSRVLDRVLGQTPGEAERLRPRPVSIFEPVDEPESATDDGAPRPIPGFAPAEPTPTAAPRSPVAAASTVAPSGRQSEPAWPATDPGPTDHDAADPADIDRTDRSASNPVDVARSVRGPQEPAPQPAVSYHVEPARFAANAPAPRAVVRPDVGEPTEAGPARRSSVTSQRASSPAGEPIRPAPVPWAPVAATVTPTRAADAPRRLSSPPPEPIVHISIGRLEIRNARPGTVPAAKQATPPRATAGPDLSDYLKARGGHAMSDARCIEAVTETLRSIVDTGATSVAPGSRAITLPPHDIAPSQDARVNVFLYQAEIDGSLRNTDPVNIVPGESGQPALPLVLHYLITPYAPDADDVLAHRLLGGALQALHSHPVLTPADLADVAPYSDISHQVESVRVAWQPLAEKDIYSLWSIFQAPYRISTAFEVRVTLIDSLVTGRAPLPVLTRGATGRGPVVGASVGYPELTSFTAPLGQPTALPGEVVTLHGTTLDAQLVTVLFNHPVLGDPLPIDPDSATGTDVTFTVPPDLPAGYGTLAVALDTPGTSTQLSNDLPFGVSPRITSALPATVAASGAPATLTLTCAPTVRPGQKCALVIGGEPVAFPSVTTTTDTLTFTIARRPAGSLPLRLRVDGADSRLIRDRTAVPPVFDPTQTVTVT